MLTFSVNEIDIVQMLRVEKTISDNIGYFKKFNGIHWPEAVNKAFMVAVQNVKSEYDVLDPYIKNLARNILREQEKESACDTVTEDGEVSYPYLKLTTIIDENLFVETDEITNAFKELYLLYEEDFLKLKLLFKKDEDKFSKGEVIKNTEIQNTLTSLRVRYGATNVFNTLYMFLKDLKKYTREIENASIKVIEMKNKEFDFLSAIPDIPLIKDENNNFYSIDKLNLTMERDPDTFLWDVVTPTSCDIVKIDISNLINYMYSQIYVSQGVFTKHISWCDSMYRLMTPSGRYFVNLEREKFMNFVKVELISTLIHNRFNTIIAISPDYIYIKPTRSVTYDTIRLILATGKIIDLPIEIHLKKRK